MSAQMEPKHDSVCHHRRRPDLIISAGKQQYRPLNPFDLDGDLLCIHDVSEIFQKERCLPNRCASRLIPEVAEDEIRAASGVALIAMAADAELAKMSQASVNANVAKDLQTFEAPAL